MCSKAYVYVLLGFILPSQSEYLNHFFFNLNFQDLSGGKCYATHIDLSSLQATYVEFHTEKKNHSLYIYCTSHTKQEDTNCYN